MIHQPSGGSQGTAADIEIQAREVLHARERLNALLAQHTGQSIDQIAEDVDRDRYMSPTEARDYGIIDRIIEPADGSNGGREPEDAVVERTGPEAVADVDTDD
jgi:ATP-dependent Clp protease protease subunit